MLVVKAFTTSNFYVRHHDQCFLELLYISKCKFAEAFFAKKIERLLFTT